MQKDQKNKNSHVNGLITCIFTSLPFTTEDMKVQVLQQNEMLSLQCTALGFISKNEESKLEKTQSNCEMKKF